MKNEFLKLVVLASVFCISGQAPRKQVQEVPANQETAQQEIPAHQIPANKHRKSAAQKARELEESNKTSMVEHKGAAKKVVEGA